MEMTPFRFKIAVIVALAFLIGGAKAFAEPAECQDVGLAKEEQAIFCMYMETAKMSFMVSASMVCEDGPDYPACVAKKAGMFKQGQILLVKATAIADKKQHRGLLKKLFQKVW